jgi:RNA polymerase sigma factor (sigma-70 family)
MSDAGLLITEQPGGASSGAASRLARLFDAYHRSAAAYLARCGVDAASRADLLQEIFIKLLRLCEAGTEPPRVLVFTVVANTARSYFRSLAVQRRLLAPASGEEGQAHGPSGEQLAEAHETATWLAAAIGRLPLLQREVLVLTCFEGMQQNEVALVLGIPVGSVKTHLRRARLALAGEMERRKAAGKREVMR